jgi:putative ABC transport system permease protein
MAWVPIGAAIIALSAISLAALWLFGTPRRVAPLLAIVRGALQLGVLSLVLSGIISDIRWVALGLLVMMGAAIVVSSRRIALGRRGLVGCALALIAGSVTAGTVVFASGALPLTSRYLLAFAGILIGNAMTTATLTGRTFRSTVGDHWDEVEGWLALGARPRLATIMLARRASFSALVPLVDQTRTTGLVVLPGAFVGAIFGGLSPIEAGVFQILVLTALIASGSIVSVLLLVVIGPVALRPADEFAPIPRQ